MRRVLRACLGLPFAAVIACGREVPTRPDALRPGTFALRLRGTAGWGARVVTLDERVTGTACQEGEYVLLDSRDGSRSLTLRVPAVPRATPTRYALGPGPRGAHGHFNHGPLMRSGVTASLVTVAGELEVAAPSPGDVHGAVRARLAEVLTEGTVSPAAAELVGVFRADGRPACRAPPHQ